MTLYNVNVNFAEIEHGEGDEDDFEYWGDTIGTA